MTISSQCSMTSCGKRFDVDLPEELVLLQAGENGERLAPLGQLGRTGGGQHEHRIAGEAVGQVVEQLQRGGVGEVDIIDEDDQRPLPGQIREDDGEGLQQPAPRRLVGRPWPGTPQGGPHTAE